MRLVTNQNSTREEFEKKLRFVTEPVGRVSDLLRNVAIDMLGFMYRSNAIGLAANQVGLKIRLCTIDPAWLRGTKMPIVLFNPEIVECGEEIYSSPEGCLSLPEFGLQVPRFRNIKVRFLGLDGKEHLLSDDRSILSSVIQHEVDHLNGNLMVDRLVEPVEVYYKDSVIKGA
jgi:peptide deformylase